MGAVRRMRRSVKRVTQADDGSTAGETRNVNVSDPHNVVISANIGEPGSVHATSSRQRVTIKQDGDETYEESETSETRI
ncbi:MAG: hypothetical protein ABR509_01715 [Candidatus Limnocylindria bacterium]